MKIDIFKYPWIYLYLEKFNQDIRDICGRHTIIRRQSEKYDAHEGGSSWWFHPENIRDLHLPSTYPGKTPMFQEPRFNLQLYGANYPTLFLINELFSNRKNIVIEDYACGMGRLIYYLSKCGYKEFNCIEDFSQVAKCLLEDTLTTAGLSHRINNQTIQAQVVNIVGYTRYYKKINTCVELYCMYSDVDYSPTGIEQLKLRDELCKKKYKLLCWDKDDMIHAYCRCDKHSEFVAKLKPYEC